MKHDEFEILMTKYLQGTLSESESTLFASLLDESDENQKAFDSYTKIWKESHELLYSNEIDVESALQKTKKQIPEFKTKVINLRLLLEIAAVLVLSLVFAVTINYFVGSKPQVAISTQLAYQEIKAAYGTQTKISLSDGSTVWLNSGSRLRFPNSFENQEFRNVELKGEGYFEVSKNPNQPFVVRAKELDIKVLGTSFNVNAYDDDHVQVALLEGKVSLMKNTRENSQELLQLKPNEVADYRNDESKVYLKKVDRIDSYAAWTEGKIVLQDVSMEELIDRLSKLYNVDFKVKSPNLWNNHFTGTFDNPSLDQVLKYLSISTSFKYRFVDPNDVGASASAKRTVIVYQ